MREVRRSELFLQQARQAFPLGGSPEGKPSFDQFAAGPLRAMEDLCAQGFEQMAEPLPGIRAWTTIALPFFPPMTFYAVMVEDYIELIGLTVDEEYDWGDD